MSEQPYKANKDVLLLERSMEGLEPAKKTETVTIPAGAAGTLKDFQLSLRPILDANKGGLGGDGSSSLTLTSTAFTNEVPYGKPDAELANGDFYINYVTGQGRGRKADTSTTATAVYYTLKPLGDVGQTTFARAVGGTLQVSAVPAKFVTARIRNGATGQYFQVHNDADGAGLSASTIKEEIYLDAFDSASIDVRSPEEYSGGIFIGSSSTGGGVYTAGATDNLLVCEYLPL